MKKYNIEDVLIKFNPIIEALKAKKRDEDEIYYYPEHKQIVSQYNRVLVHSDEGVFPSELFKHRSPNQTDEEFKWIKNNYKQVTLPLFLTYLNTIGRALHNSNWSIEYQEEDLKYKGQYFRDYVESQMPLYGNLFSFISKILISIETKDPNGVLVVKPHEYEYKEYTDTNGDVTKVLDDQKLLSPSVYYYTCEKVAYYNEDDIAIICLDEKSMVEYAGKPQLKGYVYEIHTTDSIYKVTQVGKYIEYTFTIELELFHDWGQMLCNRLGGIPKLINNKLFFETPFIYAVDNLDLVLLDSSNLMSSKAKCVYPVRVMIGSECDFVDTTGNRCNDGKIYFEGEEVLKEKICQKCNGSGLKNRISPMGELLWSPDGLQDKQTSGTEILRYVSPEIHTLEFLEEQIKVNMERSYNILHMSTTSDTANANAKSATLTNVENKAQMAAIRAVSEQTFDNYKWVLDACGWVRYGNDYKEPNIIRPVNYDFTTEKDYLDLLKFARESGASPVIIRQILIKYITSVYFTNKTSVNAFVLLLAVDTIIEKTSEEIDVLLSQGVVSKYQVIIHNSGINIIQDLYLNDLKFFEQDFEKQKEMVISKAKEMESETTPINPVNDVLNGG